LSLPSLQDFFAFLTGFRGSILAGRQPAIWSGIDTYQLALTMVRG
jgi:hypothetical protein